MKFIKEVMGVTLPLIIAKGVAAEVAEKAVEEKPVVKETVEKAAEKEAAHA